MPAKSALAPELEATRCAICGTSDNAATVYEANFQAADLTPEVFSARRSPDRLHYRIVRCRSCGLLRSDPVFGAAAIEPLYQQSRFTYGGETANLQSTYGAYLRGLERHALERHGLEGRRLEGLGLEGHRLKGRHAGKGTLLEIGCGNGFFLEEALRQGYGVVAGVEPSREAVAGAAELIRPFLTAGFFEPGLYHPEQFDVICLFQVLDHLREPSAVLGECQRLLKPGGFVLTMQHNAAALSARLLGERSPIIDIEHTYLYTPETLTRLFETCGFAVVESKPSRNRYSLNYLAHLLPLPARVKRAASRFLEATRVGRIPIRARLGNCVCVGQKQARV